MYLNLFLKYLQQYLTRNLIEYFRNNSVHIRIITAVIEYCLIYYAVLIALRNSCLIGCCIMQLVDIIWCGQIIQYMYHPHFRFPIQINYTLSVIRYQRTCISTVSLFHFTVYKISSFSFFFLWRGHSVLAT